MSINRHYSAYGSTRTSSGTLQTDRTFTGQKADGTGLLYYNARYYDPSLGTFLSPDTLVPDPSLVIDYNRFLYTRANPLRYNDPTGHCPICIIVAGLLIVGGSVAETSSGGSYSDVPDNANGQLAVSLVAGDANDIATVATGYDYISQQEVPYFSGEWWGTVGMAVLPVASGSLIHTVKMGGEEVVGIGQDLYAFGNRTAPRPPRIGTDIVPDASGMIGPSQLPFPQGASTFADISQAPLTGHYHRLPKGTALPDGLGIVSDGVDVIPLIENTDKVHTIAKSSIARSALEPFKNFCAIV